MDIFRERELLERQEIDFEDNSMFNSLPIPKRKLIIKNINIYVGETVWLEDKGPRVITSVNMYKNNHVSFLTLAEEYGRFSIDQISKYKVIEHLEFVDSIKRLDWKFIYKYGLLLCLIPVELTFIAYCVALDAEIVMFYPLSVDTVLSVMASTFLAGLTIHAIVKHVQRFVIEIKNRVWRAREDKETMMELREEHVPPRYLDIIRAQRNREDMPVFEHDNFVAPFGHEDNNEDLLELDEEEEQLLNNE